MTGTTAERHFEGLDEAALRSRRRLIGVGVLVVVVLLVLFARSTLPGPRKEFIGSWATIAPAKTYIDIHDDGTYAARFPFGYRPTDGYFSRGTWRASHDTLYLTPKTVEPDGILFDMRGFKTVRTAQLSNEQRIRIRWNGPNVIFADEVDPAPLNRGAKHP